MNLSKITGTLLCAIAMGFASCSSDVAEEGTETTVPNVAAKRTLTVTTGDGTNNAKGIATRSTVDITAGNKWEKGDKFLAYNYSAPHGHETLEAKEAGASARLEGKVTCAQGDNIALFYPYTNGETVKEAADNKQTLHPDLSRQTGRAEDMAKYDFTWGDIKNVQVHSDKATGRADMKKLYAILRLTFKQGGNTLTDIQKIRISNIPGKAKLNLGTGELTTTGKDGIIATTSIAASMGATTYDIAVFPCDHPDDFKPRFEVSTYNNKTYVMQVTAGKKIEAGKYYNVTVNLKPSFIEFPDGTVWGKYNLQYEPGVTMAGWREGYHLASSPWSYYNEESGNTTAAQPMNITNTAKVDYFRWGDIVDANKYTKEVLESVNDRYATYKGTLNGHWMSADRDMASTTLNYDEAKYGDLAYYASYGTYRLPTAEEYENMLKYSKHEYGYYHTPDGKDIYGWLFTPQATAQTLAKHKTADIQLLNEIHNGTKQAKQITDTDLDAGLFFPASGVLASDWPAQTQQTGVSAYYWASDGKTAGTQADRYAAYFTFTAKFGAAWTNKAPEVVGVKQTAINYTTYKAYARSIRPVLNR